MDTLKVENICAHIGDFRLDNISFELPVGRILTIVGASGSGKTLLLRCIAGLHRIDSGGIFFCGKRIDGLTPDKRGIGFVFQNYALFPHLSSPLNLGFPLLVKGKNRKSVESIALKTSEELNGLSEYMSRNPLELPEGMKQLIALGRERLHEFDILLLDEPLSQLDRKIHVEMRAFLKKFVAKLSKTTIAVFSDPEDALVLGDYLAVMSDGKLIQYGEKMEVYENPKNPIAMEELSILGTNKIRVDVSSRKVIPFDIDVDLDDGEYVMCFRPEEIEVYEPSAPCGIEFKIEDLSFYNANKNIAFGTLENAIEVALLIEGKFKKGETIKFLPRNPRFFSIKDIQQV